MPVSIPDAQHRWRCAGCGNLTRFDVVRDARTHEFWHFDLSGESRIEESEAQLNSLVSVSCRWCGRADAIEVVPRPEHAGSTVEYDAAVAGAADSAEAGPGAA